MTWWVMRRSGKCGGAARFQPPRRHPRARPADPSSVTKPRSTDNLIVQVVPIWIVADDQTDFPIPRPMLDVFLALDGGDDAVVRLEIDQPLHAIFAGETFRQAFRSEERRVGKACGHQVCDAAD